MIERHLVRRIARTQIETERLPILRDRIRNRPGGTQQQAEAIAHGDAQRVLLRSVERGPGSLVDDDEIGACECGGVEMGRAFGQRDAFAQADAAVQRDARVVGSAAQVLELRVWRAGEQ